MNIKQEKLKSIIFFIVVLSIVSVALYSLTLTSFGWNQWLLVTINVVFFGLFVVTLQFRRKVTRLPSSIYVAFTIAFFAEMFGLPLTMYIFMGVFGYSDIYSIEFLLTQAMGQEMSFFIHHILFPISKVIMGIGILLIIYVGNKFTMAKESLLPRDYAAIFAIPTI